MGEIIDVSGKLILNPKAREWCKLPYPDHKNGCPNYGKRDTCPPKAPKVQEYFDLDKQHWLAIVSFNLAAHIEKLKVIHPDWSIRQLSCCLYWQGAVRKQLRELCEDFVLENFSTEYSTCPEAMGVDLFETIKQIGYKHKIEKNPMNIVLKIALIGYLK